MPTERPAATPSERLSRWNRIFNPVVVTAAILGLAPLAGDADTTDGPGTAVAIGTWIVFALDFAVRARLDRAFLSGWKGRVYLGIVVVTFPLYLVVPSLGETDLLVVSRLGWLSVLMISGLESMRDMRMLIRRVGVAGIAAVAATVSAALLVRRVEDAENGFDTVGESLWWAAVTITTVGYGDRVPVTPAGRMIAVFLMVGGLTFLGVVAASLAAHFGFEEDAPHDGEAPDDERYDQLLAEVRALRADVARLSEGAPTGGPDAPEDRQDPAASDVDAADDGSSPTG